MIVNKNPDPKTAVANQESAFVLSGISDLYFGSYPLADYPEFQQGGFYGCIKNAKIHPDSIDHSVISSDQVDLVNVELECEPVTGERLPGEHTSLEFEIATLATDGSGFSGEKAQVVSSKRSTSHPFL